MSEDYKADWAEKDFYAELGVGKTATQDEIKKAYRKLARENHPDSNPGDESKHEKFKRVAEAYDVVGDEAKRKKYDEFRSVYSGTFAGGQGPGFGFSNYSGAPGGQNGRAFNFEDLFQQAGGAPGAGQQNVRVNFADGQAPPGGFGDLFGDMFGGRRARRPQPGPDLESSATISFEDALEGVTIRLRVTQPDGSAKEIQARIPAGVKDGQRIRLKGKGGAGGNGGPYGDLYVAVNVKPHRLFSRKDDNLTIDVPVSFDEAALGAEIRIPTFEGGSVTLKVPGGTPNGRTFRIRGKGVKKKDGTSGDLLATVEVQVPAVLDDAARKAVEDFRVATAHKPLRANFFGDTSE